MSSTTKKTKLKRYASSTRFLFQDASAEEESPLLNRSRDLHAGGGNGSGTNSTCSTRSSKSGASLHSVLEDEEKGAMVVFDDKVRVSVDKKPRPKFKIKQSTDERITFSDEVRGAFIFNIPAFLCLPAYAVRIYLHYWLWQIPVLFFNIGLFFVWTQTHYNSHPTIALTELGYLAVSPVLMSALVRDKIFLWFVYWLVKKTVLMKCCCSQQGRYHISRLADCIGGLHSSSGVTALFWNVIYCIGCWLREDLQLNWRSGTALLLPILLLVICLSALPCIRHHYHNSFEIVHRYLGWLCLACLITHVTFVNIFHATTWAAVFSNETTIFTILILILTVYPWVIMHRTKGRDVEIHCANQSTAYIFPFDTPMGAVCKMSIDFVEFHIMGITPLLDGRSFVLCKSLGDWTSELNERARDQPRTLDDVTFYVTRIKSPNFTQGLFNWDRVFVLVTGSGIAPLLPYVVKVLEKPLISLVWVARDHANNYPKFIIDILEDIPNVVLYDTTKMPRPNLSKMTIEYAEKFDAQAVFLVSNPTLAYGVSNVVTKRGIPVFASNFDV